MSTILDALRRLQRDREGEAGDPGAAQPRPGRYARGAPRVLFMLVALLFVAVAGAWYFFSEGEPTEGSEQAQAAQPVPGRPLARRSQAPDAAVQTVESARERKASPPPDEEEDVRDPVIPPRPPITPAAEKVLRKRAAARGIPYKEMVKQYMAIKPKPPPPVPDVMRVSPEEAMSEQDLEEVERMFAEMDANFAASGQPTSESLVPKRTLPLRERYARMEVDPSLPPPGEEPVNERAGKGTATVKVVSEPPVRTSPNPEPAPAVTVERKPAPPTPAVQQPAQPPSASAKPPSASAQPPPKVARAEPRAEPPQAPPKAETRRPPMRSVTEEPAESVEGAAVFPSVVVQSVRWHPDPERRVVWLQLDQTGLLELQEGDIAGGVMIRRIDPSGVEVQVGEVRKEISVGR